MAAPFAFVTLVTSDSYLPGALALAGALKDLHPSPPVPPEVDFQTVCLVSPETVDVSTIKLLRRAFDVVIGVEVIKQNSSEGLKLLGRPDLNTVLTKLHVFRLTQYSKIVFLDADVLPIRPLSHLFTIPYEFSAVPDVGWPDIFNSGVMVLSPGIDKFNELTELLKSHGSWDGGDQGILNEWRGGNWNRLSFTYNTTPTAAYTYAPAYERFGSKISAVHFIGPNKPWSSIPYRAPGSMTARQETSDSIPNQSLPVQQQAYDYSSLVDRWYAVYDNHYRSKAILPETEFEVRKYVPAWDERKSEDVRPTSAPAAAPIGGSLGLEDLRRIAVEGMGATVTPADNRTGDGEYFSLPLEGRVDLMPLRVVDSQPMQLQSEPQSQLQPEPPSHAQPESLQSENREKIPPGDRDFGSPSTPIQQRRVELPEESEVRLHTLPTPGPNEVPPTPHLSALSLPPTPSHVSVHQQPKSDENPHIHTMQPEGSPQSHEHHHDIQQQQQSIQHHHIEPPRPSSPPLFSWNPAIEPPPKSTPSVSAFPSDTYFPNVWDQSPSRHHDETHQTHSVANLPASDSGAFFEPPPPSEIPQSLIREGHYRNVTGPLSEEVPGSSPSPDRSKVKRVFPWEDKPRQLPSRVFPSFEAPPPDTLFIQELPQPPPPTVPSPDRALTVRDRPSPSYGLPTTLSYANAWDNVPSIQKYASKLIRPPQPPVPLEPAFSAGRPRKGVSSDRASINSHDGDVEDEGDDESDDAPVSTQWNDDSEGESGKSTSKQRSRGSSYSSRTGSLSPSQLIQGKKKEKREYKNQGVQTIPKETRNQGVQVTTTPPAKQREVDVKLRPRATSTNGRRSWAPATGSNLLPPVSVPEVDLSLEQTGSVTPTVFMVPSSLSVVNAEPSGVQSPREWAYSPAVSSSPRATTPPLRPIQTRLTDNSRKSSNETVTSPLSSVGPVSPPEGQPIGLSARKSSGRVWDPARGVELFKRGSEEVLARFLKMGSWEDNNQAAHRV